MRVKSEIWVKAFLRRCQAEAVPAVVAQRGEAAAGAIFICVNLLDGTVSLYGPAPAGLESSASDRHWVRCLGRGPVDAAEANVYLVRQREFDPDLWIIEIEDRAGRHFLGDEAVDE